MSRVLIITEEEILPQTLDIMEYLVTIRKNNEFVKGFLFQGFSGTSMQDIVPEYRKQFPASEGYTVEW